MTPRRALLHVERGKRRSAGALVGLAALVCGAAASAQDVTGELPPPAISQPEAGEPDPDGVGAEGGAVERVDWSATLIAAGKLIAEREAQSGAGGFFDQYEFTPNKSSGFPVELGVRDGHLDLFGELDAPIFQLRLNSPTSNLGISGSEVDQPFFNQRIGTWTRHERWAVDLEYRRMRTEELRRFPDTGDGALVFGDTTAAQDRFYRDRTGFLAEARGAFGRFDGLDPATAGPVASELALRGGYDARDGLGQLRLHRDPNNDWLGLGQPSDRTVGEIGGGVLLGRATSDAWLVTLDFDHERLRWQSDPLTELDLGAAPPQALRPLGFVPDSDRSIGRVSARGRLFGNLTWNAGYRISALDQSGAGTPEQQAAGLEHNRVITHSAEGALRWRPTRAWAVRADVDFDLRDNDIDRTTPLYAPAGGSQVAPHVEDWQRIVAQLEVERRFLRRNTVSLGVRYEDIERDLDFAEPGAARILPENALVGPTTRFVDVFAKARLRPAPRVRVGAEIGYRAAPDVGYVTDLDNFVHGEIDARWMLSTARPVSLRAYVRGDGGSNDGFATVDGLGPDPPGPAQRRRFERWTLGWGVGVESQPLDRLMLHATFLCDRLEQNGGVVVSNVQRTFQENVALAFTDIGLDAFQNEQKSLVLGAAWDFGAGFDLGGAYTWTYARGRYQTGGDPRLDLVRERRRIENHTQVLDLEAGWTPKPGLRLLAGYRLQWHGDDVDAPESIASAMMPVDRSTYQHTLTIGARLDAGLFEGRD